MVGIFRQLCVFRVSGNAKKSFRQICWHRKLREVAIWCGPAGQPHGARILACIYVVWVQDVHLRLMPKIWKPEGNEISLLQSSPNDRTLVLIQMESVVNNQQFFNTAGISCEQPTEFLKMLFLELFCVCTTRESVKQTSQDENAVFAQNPFTKFFTLSRNWT